MKEYRAWVLLALACALMAASASWAVTTAAISNAGLPVDKLVAINSTAGLAFGKFVAGSSGTVTVGPGGVRSASGGVVLVPSGAGAAAQFAVSGDANLTYAISLPGNGVVTLVSGTNSMAVNNFTSNPNLTGKLSAEGAQTLFVGATLSVGGNQPPGSYTGLFDVTVNYN